MAKPLIVLTAAIQPGMNVPTLQLRDPSVRVVQYADSLSWWINLALKIDADVAFVDGSPVPVLDLLYERVSPTVREVTRFIHLPIDAAVTERGKGAGEGLLIDRALAELTVHHSVFVKATGRLKVRNASSLIQGSRTCGRAAFSRNLNFADSRFFVAGADLAHGYLMGMGESVDDPKGIYLEHILAQRFLAAFADGFSFQPWLRPPLYQGVSGTSGAAYDAPRQKLSWAYQCAIRTLMGKRIIV